MISSRRGRSTSTQFHKVHKYFVGNVIAKGTFSCIYSAYRVFDYFSFAVKMISKRKFKCQDISEFMFGEKVLAPLLIHPHIVKIYEIIESQGQLFQVQDFYENGDLLTYSLQMNPNRATLLRLIDEVLSAIEYMHSYHLCHRDIKPENVLLTNKLSAKLTDFGFTTFSIDGKNRSKCGSFGYAAPEVVKQEEYDGMKADVWSIGVLIYNLFAKHTPFAEETENKINLSPDKIDYSKVPSDVAFVIRQCLNLRPENRPTVSEIRKSPIFDQIPRDDFDQVSHPNIETSIDEPIMQLASRISEYLEKSIFEVEEMLRQESINEAKILYHLIKHCIKLNKTAPDFVSAFHSLPENHLSQLKFDLPEEIQINENGYKVDEALNELLLPRKFCVATSIQGDKSIVLNLPGDDIYLDISVIDNPDKKTCKLIMSGNVPADSYLTEVTDLIKSKFHIES